MTAKKSKYKTKDSREWLEKWLEDVLKTDNLDYERLNFPTLLGNTSILAKNHGRKELEPLVFLPGGRTCGIFWDLNGNLAPLYADYRIYLVDVNGQPGLSDGNAPLIDSDGYGRWLKEVLDKLELNEAVFIGASFGGSLIAKLAEVDAGLIKKAFLCNPAGFANISFGLKNLYYLLAPLILKTPKTIENFLDKIVFHADFKIDRAKRAQLAAFLLYTNKNFVMGAENPRPFPDEVLEKLTAPTYLMLDRDDRFINQGKTEKRAKKILPKLVETVWLEKHGHGIELSDEVVAEIKKRLEIKIQT
ncbi:MAG TPA: alpha/beta hydrolase [Pyrinomonadaceae bacterium]|jgi:pimeloyl-ACP methyl ester carboxylesterase